LDRTIVIAVVIFAVLLAAPFVANQLGGTYVLSLLMKAMLLAIAALSLDLLIGQSGMVSFGHAAFVGLGAYATGVGLEEGIEDVLILLLITLGVTGLFAVITGALALRTSGVYFIMITLAFGQMAYFTLTSLAAYGGDDGLTLWSTAELFGTDVVQKGSGLYFVITGSLIATWWLVHRIAGSRFGRVLRAAKENPERTEIMGFSVFRFRLIAYVIAGMIAGVSGLLLAQQAEFISPAISTWQKSGELIVVVVLGGMGTRNGAVLGAIFFVLVEEFLGGRLHEWKLIFGPLLVLMVLYSRGGISDLLSARPKELFGP
jgi:branched-chain amino acid transport system permease protein